MSRIKSRFNQLLAKKQKALIPYVMAGDPSLIETEKIVLELEKSGADLIELGVPFSDPVADGPTIQKAAERALRQGVTLKAILDLVMALRKRSRIPIILMTYLNPILAMGVEPFFRAAREAQLDGVIIPDLPLEEAQPFLKVSRRHLIHLIFIIAPTTPMERVNQIVSACGSGGGGGGFIYYVSLTGVTGATIKEVRSVTEQIEKIKAMTRIPVAAGFGIASEEEARAIAHVADGIIVGSSLVKIIETASHDVHYLSRLSQQVASLKAAIRTP